VIGLIGIGVMTMFGTFHILAAITGVLLWQWERHRLPPSPKALEAATIYFCLAVLASIFFNYLAANVLDRIL
jgi:cytochrome bd-type quinol oxidase subunit 1